jgi:hypothetical protein
MRTQENRDALRAKLANRHGSTHVTVYPSEAAALRMLGHVGCAAIDAAGVVRWQFPASAAADGARFADEARRASAERWQLYREGPAEPTT